LPRESLRLETGTLAVAEEVATACTRPALADPVGVGECQDRAHGEDSSSGPQPAALGGFATVPDLRAHPPKRVLVGVRLHHVAAQQVEPEAKVGVRLS